MTWRFDSLLKFCGVWRLFFLFHHITVLADDFFAYFCAIIGGMQLLCVFNKERACSRKLEC